VVDGKIYAIGGMAQGKPISTVEVYDPVTDKWTKKTGMPTARYGVSTSAVNGKIYVIGGAPSQEVTFATVEEYNPTTDTWTTKADMPTSRFYHSASVVNGKIYAIGGWTGNAEGEVFLSTVEEYDPLADKWTGKADLPTARGGLSTSVANGKIYAIGGVVMVAAGLYSYLSAVEEYNTGAAVKENGKLAATWGNIKRGR
jgi:N-acetylneuraminic acid mutarotase